MGVELLAETRQLVAAGTKGHQLAGRRLGARLQLVQPAGRRQRVVCVSEDPLGRQTTCLRCRPRLLTAVTNAGGPGRDLAASRCAAEVTGPGLGCLGTGSLLDPVEQPGDQLGGLVAASPRRRTTLHQPALDALEPIRAEQLLQDLVALGRGRPEEGLEP